MARVRIPTGTDVLLYLVDDEPVTGVWCDDCALPSGVEGTFLLADEEFTVIARLRVCVDCLWAVKLA